MIRALLLLVAVVVGDHASAQVAPSDEPAPGKHVLIGMIAYSGGITVIFNDWRACENARARLAIINGTFAAHFVCEPLSSVRQ